MNKEKMRAWIDQADYESLLRMWRFAIPGEPIFQGDMGDYYREVLARKREEIGPEEATKASKRVGWKL